MFETLNTGRDSNLLRLALANITAAEPDGLIDAGITTYFFYPADENSPRRERIPFKDFFKVGDICYHRNYLYLTV